MRQYLFVKKLDRSLMSRTSITRNSKVFSLVSKRSTQLLNCKIVNRYKYAASYV